MRTAMRVHGFSKALAFGLVTVLADNQGADQTVCNDESDSSGAVPATLLMQYARKKNEHLAGEDPGTVTAGRLAALLASDDNQVEEADAAETWCSRGHPPSSRELAIAAEAGASFSQDQQDLRLENILPDHGFFIEAGAADGVNFSNTLFFERKGWSGMLVEPIPWTFERLLENHRKAWAFNVALSTSGRPGYMYISPADCNGGTDSMCSTISRGKRPGSLQVPVLPLAALLACTGQTSVDFWSLDVEGVESGILRTFPFDKIMVGVLLIEMNKSTENTRGIEEVMARFGFQECGRTRFDRIYVLPKYFLDRGRATPGKC